MPGQHHDLHAVDRRHLIHPLHHPIDNEHTIIWAAAHGSTIEDSEGRRYLDGLSGLWNVNAGHGRHELVNAAVAQMATLAYCSGFVGSSNEASIRLAERLVDLTGGALQAGVFPPPGAQGGGARVQKGRLFLE